MAETRPKPLIAGNWKLHKTVEASRELAEAVLDGARDLVAADRLELGLFPTALALPAVTEVVRRAGLPVLIGAQNLWYESEGAFTGEISAPLIRAAGGNSVLVGHSERRHVFGEPDEWMEGKVAAALEAGLRPILCVGETLEQREAGRTSEVVAGQLDAGLAGVRENPGTLERGIIAYEPVWAIGTGHTATPEQAQEVHQLIRGRLGEILGDGAAARGIPVLYGGSVKPRNAGDLLAQPDIDGALVGGASLDPESFLGICRAAPGG